MPTYEITDPQTGQKLRITGDSPPSEQELEQIFASQRPAEPKGFTGAGVAEPAATIASSIVAEPVAGIAGLLSSLAPVGGALSPEAQAFAEPTEIAPAGPDVGTEVIEATREALTFQPRTEKGQESLQAVGETLQPVAEFVSGLEKSLGDAAFDATDSPALAAAATTVPTAILEALGVGLTKGVLKVPSKVRQVLGDRKIRKAIVASAPEVDELKRTSTAVYREIDESGVSVKPESMTALVSEVEKNLQAAKFKPSLAKETASSLDELKTEAGVAQSLSDIDALRQNIQGTLSGTATPNDKRLTGVITDTLDEFLDKASSKDFVMGGLPLSEIMPKYKTARELWGRARRSELITEAFDRAGTTASGFENGLRQEFRRILRNKKQSRFFKPGEIAAMKEVIQGTDATNITKLIGRFGFSEGAATNVLGGTAGLYLGGPLLALTGQISRKMSQRLTQRGASFADAIVRAGDDAKKLTSIYMSKVPKKQRTVEELSELFLRQNADLKDMLLSDSKFVREAAETAKGRRVIEALAVSAPGAIEGTQGEQQ